MDSIKTSLVPIITAFSDKVVQLCIKNTVIFFVVVYIFNECIKGTKLEKLGTMVNLLFVPFLLWNTGECIKLANKTK